jgi:hypothetical protein
VSALDDLVAVLQRFDDEAWAALANKGLVRRARKDLDALEVALASADPVVVQVGEHQVEFGASGPAGGACSCPAVTICQHVVTAGLWLAGHGAQDSSPVTTPDSASGADPGAGPGVDPGAGPPPALADTALHDELMALDQAALVAHGGRAALRWAAQLVADLDPDDVRISQGQQVQISFAAPRLTFRFVGGGLTGLISDVRLPAPEKYAVAAVLAYQRAHGAEPTPVEPLRARETATSRAQVGGRSRFLHAVSELLLDTVRLGASHLSPAVHQRYETIAVWAQGAELHRLALLLRRLADQVELLLDRSARADEHALLDEAAIAYALVSALDSAGEPPPSRLAGRARTTYTTVRSMELVGLGGMPWRAASGYHGLTCLFWWEEERRFVSWTDARPDSLWNFDPRARYTQPGPWTGLNSPSLTAGRSVRLTDAQLSPNGRLSGVERTHAAVGPLVDPPWSAMPVVDTWASLEERVRGRRSLLDESDPLRDWVLLRPAAADPAVFDPIRQTVWWALRDGTGSSFSLSMRWTPLASPAVQRLESLTSAEMPAGALVVARLAVRSGQLTGEPLSIVRGDRVVDVLHFDPAAARSTKERRLTERPEEEEGQAPLPGPLLDLRTWLLRQMERGTGSAAPAVVLGGLDQRHRAVRDLGFAVFPAVADGSDPAVALLRSHYVGLQVAELLA